MGKFLEPGELFEIEATCGVLVCKSLSFRQQRELIKLLKQMQGNNDPVVAMDLVESALRIGVNGWHRSEAFDIDKLLDLITGQEAIDLVRRITEETRLSEDEQKK